MGLIALWVMGLLSLWAIGAFVAMRFLPRHRTLIVVSAVTAPVAAVLLLFSILGGFSRSASVPPSEGITNAQVGKCLAEVFSEENLGRLIQREGLSAKLAPSEVKPRIAITDPVDERDSFHWTVSSGNTWKWKADAYSRLAKALSGDIDTRLGTFKRAH
jgi:hypothetical protein